MPQARAAAAAPAAGGPPTRTRARRRRPFSPRAASPTPTPRLLLLLALPLLLSAGAARAAAPPQSSSSCASSSSGGACPAFLEQAEPEPPLVCVVVRTYWAHGSHGDSALTARLLRSLRLQTHARWRALLVVLDSRPFPDLHHLVADFGDPRVEVFAEWIAARYAARAPAAAAAAGGGGGAGGADAGGGWAPSYHDALYNATDAAVRACPRETEWLAVTNGDNEYDPEFLAAAVAAGAGGAGGAGSGGAGGGGAGNGGGKKKGEEEGSLHPPHLPFDIVAADYYTRYVRPTGPPCDRFSNETVLMPTEEEEAAWAAKAANEGNEAGGGGGGGGGKKAAPAPQPPLPPPGPPGPCKPNLLRWCQTDLAATLYYWPRFVEEDVRFWDASIPGDAAGSHDGRLAEALASAGLAPLRRKKAEAAHRTALKAAAAAGLPPPPAPRPYVPLLPSEEKPWRAARLFPGERCMVDHNPTPQRCAEEGGVWDDSRRASRADTGGRCLDKGEAGLLLARDQGLDLLGEGGGGRTLPAPRLLELVEVDVAHDGRSFGRGGKGGGGGASAAAPLPPLRCIRLRDRAAWRREARFFGPKCHAEQEGGEGWAYG